MHADGVRYAEHAKTLGVTSAPGVVLHHGGKAGGNAKYVLRGLISERTLRAFVENWRAGKLPKFVRSQPVPKKQSKAVKVVVGKSVAEVALDPTKDVIVEFFAPWCGECKKFGPILEKWAASMATEDPNLVVAAMDHTQNDFDLEGVSVTAYPTVYLFPAGDAALKRAPRVFEGDRTAKGLAAFLRDVRQERDAPKVFVRARALDDQITRVNYERQSGNSTIPNSHSVLRHTGKMIRVDNDLFTVHLM